MKFDPVLAEYLASLQELYPEKVPSFSCDYGTSQSKLLFVLEAPGPRVMKTTRKICPNNPDQTARNTKEFLRKAGLAPKDCLMWNIVPLVFCQDEETKKWRNVTPNAKQIKQGAKHLNRLINLMPKLKAVVLVGKKAQQARGLITVGQGVKIIFTGHPSPQNVNRPGRRAKVQQEFFVIPAKAGIQRAKRHEIISGFPM